MLAPMPRTRRLHFTFLAKAFLTSCPWVYAQGQRRFLRKHETAGQEWLLRAVIPLHSHKSAIAGIKVLIWLTAGLLQAQWRKASSVNHGPFSVLFCRKAGRAADCAQAGKWCAKRKGVVQRFLQIKHQMLFWIAWGKSGNGELS